MKDKQTIKITFPNLMLIPLISIIGCILKICNATNEDWLFVLFIMPISTYFLWCISYIGIAIMAIWLYRVWKGDNKK